MPKGGRAHQRVAYALKRSPAILWQTVDERCQRRRGRTDRLGGLAVAQGGYHSFDAANDVFRLVTAADDEALANLIDCMGGK